MISVRPAGRLPVSVKNVNVAIFSGTINMINFKLFMIVVLTIPLSVTFIVFQG